MNSNSINKINNKLKAMPESDAIDILQYLEFLHFKNSANEFILSNEQINILEKRNKTPIEDCMPASDIITNLKNKYRV